MSLMPHGLHLQSLVTLNTVAQEMWQTSIGPFFQFLVDLGSTSKINAVQKKRKKKVSRDVSHVMHLESFSCGCCHSAAAAIPAPTTVP